MTDPYRPQQGPPLYSPGSFPAGAPPGPPPGSPRDPWSGRRRGRGLRAVGSGILKTWRAIRLLFSIVATIAVLAFVGYLVYDEYLAPKTYTAKGTEVGVDATEARVGDCGTGDDVVSPYSDFKSHPVTVVKCTDVKANFKVVGILKNRAKPTGFHSDICDRFARAEITYYETKDRYDDTEKVTVACLARYKPRAHPQSSGERSGA